MNLTRHINKMNIRKFRHPRNHLHHCLIDRAGASASADKEDDRLVGTVEPQGPPSLFGVSVNHFGRPGISRVDEAFRMFRRLNHPTRYGEGTGAGLAFVRKVVEANGGWIRLVSEPGQGTTFYISLARPVEEPRPSPGTGGEAMQIA